jgi:hypothetical protein
MSDEIITGAEKRINDRLLAYWGRLTGESGIPNEEEIDITEIADVWSHCFLVKVDDKTSSGGYKYTYLGESLIEMYGWDSDGGKSIYENLIDPEADPFVDKVDQVVQSGKSLSSEEEFTNANGQLIKYRSCLLPLGASRGEVGYVLGGIRWKAF